MGFDRLTPTEEDFYASVYSRGVERYVVLWRADRGEEMTRAVARWAMEPGLSFTWHDAAKLLESIRDRIACDAPE